MGFSFRNTGLLLALSALLLSGCATKVKVAALEPAEVDRATNLRQVGVLGFQNDKIGLSSKIEARLASYKLKESDEATYYTVVSRADLDKLIEEQKFQHSGLTDESKIVQLGKMLNAQALISGTVSNASTVDTNYKEPRSRCASYDGKGKCLWFETYYVDCTKRSSTVGAQVKMIDVVKGDLVTAKTYTKSDSSSFCAGDVMNVFSGGLKDGAVMLEEMSNAVANEFVRSISPHYIYFEVELIEKLDVEIDKVAEERFKGAIDFIKAGRLDKAEEMLSDLMDKTQGQSYVISYDLGILKEGRGELDEAEKLYKNADKLKTKPIKPIDDSVMRIKTAIEKQKKALKQMQGK